MIPSSRIPTHAGVILLEEFLKPLGMTQVQLAEKIGVPIQRINTLINGKRGMSAETAILLAKALNTTPEFWMNIQVAVDLAEARTTLGSAA